MFAVEIQFRDGISPPEVILVRRSTAIVGSSDLAHVVIDGAASSHCELRLIRGVGRQFSCFPVRRPGQSLDSTSFKEGTYQAEADIELGELNLHITALDNDLSVPPGEGLEHSTARVFRRALSSPSPGFPAVAIVGVKPVIVSFSSVEPLLVGRSRKCGLRLDGVDVAQEHLAISCENSTFFVEPQIPQAATYVNSEKLNSRVAVFPGDLIRVGSDFFLTPVSSEEDILAMEKQAVGAVTLNEEDRYPCIVAKGAEVRPMRRLLREGDAISIGRDPTCDIWINAPHVSRKHLDLILPGLAGATSVKDLVGGQLASPREIHLVDGSSNGVFVDGQRLPRSEIFAMTRDYKVLDFCSGVQLAICFSEEQELAFFESTADELVSSDLKSDQTSSSGKSSYEWFATRNAKDANNSEVKASEQQPIDVIREQSPILDETSTDLRVVVDEQINQHNQSRVADEGFIWPAGELSEQDFKRSQLSSESGLLRQGGGIFDTELTLEEDELLRSTYFKGVNRFLLGLLVMLVVVIVCLLFIGVFSDFDFF